VQTIVELKGVNGDVIHQAGPRAGQEGMYLAEDGMDGIMDPPIKVFWDDQMDTPGEVYTGYRYEAREVTLKVHVLSDDGVNNWWETRDTRYRKLFSPDKQAELRIITGDGLRILYIRLVDNHKVNTRTDPRGRTLNTITTSVKAGDPFWHGKDNVHVEVLEAGDSTFNVVMENATDQMAWPVWVIPESSRTTLPDYDFTEDPPKPRAIRMPQLLEGESCVVQVDPRYKQVEAENGAPVLARMNGKRLLNHLPPWTPPTQVPVTVEGATAGQEVMLRIPRLYTTPWGLNG